MLKSIGKFWSMLLIVTMSAFGVVSVEGENTSAEAANAVWFNPGQIISDSAFYAPGTMSAKSIQRFLNSKVAVCRADPTRPGCLKDYRLNTPAVTGTDGRCASLPAKTNVSAAQVIYDISIACGISPKVLLVKLQKEQGLVTSTNPSRRAYEFALGMDCPDTPSGCSAASAGFFWQLYKGAGQLNWYSNPAGSFTWLKPGATISRPFQANNASCGSQSFVLENKATAALYYYTPYVPNQAALANLYGVGDTCSAYGNRNFFRDYTDWFGSTIGGSFLIKGDGPDVFLIVDENKYRIPSSGLLNSLKPLGPVGTVPNTHLDRFTTVGDMSGLARSAVDGSYFFISKGSRRAFTSCDEIATWGLDCANAVTLTGSQVSSLGVLKSMASLFGRFTLVDGLLTPVAATPSPTPSPTDASPSPSPTDASPSPSPTAASPSPTPSPTAASPSPAPATTTTPVTTYTVVRGDTLSGIAARFGTTTRNLMTLNSITNANRIRVGQVLIISGTSTPAASTPAASTTSYTVARGDTLSGIAARFGTTTRNLMTLNSITNANRIRVGQVLIISGTSTPAASTPAASTPAASATSYTVVRGDTLSGIAARFGTTTRNLMTLNGITNANLLRVGQVLRLA